MSNRFLPDNNLLFDANRRISQLRTLLRLILLIVSSLLATHFIQYDFNQTHIALISTIFVLSLFYVFLTLDTSSIISGMLIWGLTILTLFLAWHNGGLYASAITALPGILMLAIISTNRVVFIPLVLFILLAIYALGYAHVFGLIAFESTDQIEFVWRKAFDISVVLFSFSLVMSFISKDILNLFRNLSQQNETLLNEKNEAIKLGNYDDLTELPNERLCFEGLESLITIAKKKGSILAFITLDIHNYKDICSSLGHSQGDLVLKELAVRLLVLFNDQPYLYRFPGNEFVILHPAIDYEEVSVFAEQILQALTSPFMIREYEIELLGAIGVAIAPFDGDSMELLRKKSHLALYKIKDKKTCEYHFYDEDLESIESNKYQMIKALKLALENDEFELYFQPKVDLSNGKIIGAEALIRWHRPNHGMVPPDVFIGLAEESGLIVDLTKWVAKNAIQACKGWHSADLNHLSVAINLSAVDFRRGNLPQTIFKMLNNACLSTHYLELELTESMIIDDQSHVQSQILELHTKGVMLAIDDFGTGYSNLGYLSRFNVTTLKIDQSFIKRMNDTQHDYLIVKAIIQLGQSLGISIVAEGVEDQENAELLKQLNCQYGQGYYWSKPLKNEDFIQLVKKHNVI